MFEFNYFSCVSPFQSYSFLLCNTFAVFNGFFIQLTIRWESDVLLLNGRVNPDFLYFPADYIFAKQVNALLEDFLHTCFSYAFAKMNEVTWVKGKLILKIDFSAKVLPVWILQISLNNRLITKIIHLLQYQQPNDSPNWNRRPAS